MIARSTTLVAAGLVGMLVTLGLLACGDPAPAIDEPERDPTPTPITPVDTPDEPDVTGDPGSDGDAYFAGQTIRVIVGFPPGGGYDVYSRIVVRYLGNYLEGDPNFVVQNLVGAGGERGLRQTMRSDPDGLTVGLLHPTFIKRELAGIDVPDFDLETVGIIGTPNFRPTASVYHVRSDVATSWDEVLALGRPIVHGQDIPGASGEAGAKFVELVGGPIRILYGYGGSAEAHAAVDRGEVDTGGGFCSLAQTPTLFPEHLEQDLCAPLFWYGLVPPEEDPLVQEWLDLIGKPLPPHIFDLQPMSDAPEWQKDMLEVVLGLNMASHIFVLPPGTPDHVLAVWRQAFADVVHDPDFLEHARATGREIGFGDAETLMDMFEQGLVAIADPEHREFFLEYLGVVE